MWKMFSKYGLNTIDQHFEARTALVSMVGQGINAYMHHLNSSTASDIGNLRSCFIENFQKCRCRGEAKQYIAYTVLKTHPKNQKCILMMLDEYRL